MRYTFECNTRQRERGKHMTEKTLIQITGQKRQVMKNDSKIIATHGLMPDEKEKLHFRLAKLVEKFAFYR